MHLILPNAGERRSVIPGRVCLALCSHYTRFRKHAGFRAYQEAVYVVFYASNKASFVRRCCFNLPVDRVVYILGLIELFE